MKYLIISLVAAGGLFALTLRNTGESNPLKTELNNSVNISPKSEKDFSEFNDYWYSGLAELSGYDLLQSRYGEIHEGTATMIFVTEPFSKKKHVKLDYAEKAGNDKVSVLKLNSTRKFLTGIYPYTMMTSTFNPVHTEHYKSALKVGLSGQEWCGHVYQQMNLEGSKYKVKSFSYFESEGDQNYSIPKSFLEDELYNIIRLNPQLLPTGNINLTPSMLNSRFSHLEVKPYTAKAERQSQEWNGMMLEKYSITYETGRILNIYFQPEFPYVIEGWEDSYKGMGGKELTSTAIRKNTKKLAYWSLHDNKDRPLNQVLYTSPEGE